MSKEYGLIKADKSKKQPKVTKNVFSSDDDAPTIKKTKVGDLSVTQKKQAKKIQEEALAEDPSVFQYDEVYEEIDSKRKEAKLAKKSTEARASKYIQQMMVTTDKRKKEQERRIERQVQKEREAEGEEFKDKEAFVTSSYRKKLEEMKAAEDADKREAYLENIGDVTKQSDLSGFYRHIYSQKVGDEKDAAAIESTALSKDELKPDTSSKKKNYRKRKSSVDQGEKSEKEESAGGKKSDKAHLVSNLDADSDFSIDSSSDSEEDSENKKDLKKDKSPKPASVDPAPELNGSNGQEFTKEIDELPKELPKPKVKIDIWKKRTIGVAFDEALERYYQRKAEREQAA